MDQKEFEQYHNRHISFELENGEKLTGVILYSLVNARKKTANFAKFIQSADLETWKKYFEEGKSGDFRSLETVINIEDIVVAEILSRKYIGLMRLKALRLTLSLKLKLNSRGQKTQKYDIDKFCDAIVLFIEQFFGPDSHYINDYESIISRTLNLDTPKEHDFTFAIYQNFSDQIKLLINDLSDSLEKSSNQWFEGWDNVLDIPAFNEKGLDDIEKGNFDVSIKSELNNNYVSHRIVKVLIASPSDVTIRKQLLNELETTYRRKNYEELSKCRIVIEGWENLPSQSGYGQDIINGQILKDVDIIIAVFRHKLGTPTINVLSGEVRSPSGTAEELLYAIRNKSIPNPPLGMAYFYSEAPVISLDSMFFDSTLSEWNRLKSFRNEIRNEILYTTYQKDDQLLNTLCDDLCNVIRSQFQKK